jgi:hypothetical protein
VVLGKAVEELTIYDHEGHILLKKKGVQLIQFDCMNKYTICLKDTDSLEMTIYDLNHLHAICHQSP